jgi:8-oxo-dGTP pyrophosphatase MutT (NUDIX family)
MSSFVHRLSFLIQNDLPGESAHIPLSPLHRPITSEVLRNLKEYKESAVSVIIYKEENVFKCVLIQRSVYLGKHSGQISFPGGKKDSSDEDLLQTAKRECFEEIGIDLTLSILLGKLSAVYIPVSGFLVEPYVFYFDYPMTYKTSEREVASVFSIELNQLIHPEVIKDMYVSEPTGLVKDKVPCFNLADKQIWGATALILNELRELVKRVVE